MTPHQSDRLKAIKARLKQQGFRPATTARGANVVFLRDRDAVVATIQWDEREKLFQTLYVGGKLERG